MASYILRNIDVELWRKVKGYAALRGLNIRTLIESLLTAWVAGQEPADRPSASSDSAPPLT